MLNAVKDRDEALRPTGLPAPADPDFGGATTLPVRLAVAGSAAAVLGVLAAVIGLVDFASLAGPGIRRGWEVVLLVSAVVMLLICLAQLLSWRRAHVWSRDGRATELAAVARRSWLLHLASYVVVLSALLSGLGASADAVWTTSSAAWFTASMVLVIAGQVLGAVQYVRLEGPPGTVPAHLRRLRAWVEQQRRFDDDDPEVDD